MLLKAGAMVGRGGGGWDEGVKGWREGGRGRLSLILKLAFHEAESVR